MRIITVNDMTFENAGDVRIDVRIEGIGSLLVNCTSEGVIIDAFGEDGEQIGTSSEMFDEIHERLRLKEARFAAAAQINAAIDEPLTEARLETLHVLDRRLAAAESAAKTARETLVVAVRDRPPMRMLSG
mgnify:CR=1 FL=1